MGTGYKVAVASIVVVVLAVVGYYLFIAPHDQDTSNKITTDTSHLPQPTPPVASGPSQRDPSLTTTGSGSNTSTNADVRISDNEPDAPLNRTARKPADDTHAGSTTTGANTTIANNTTNSSTASSTGTESLSLSATDGSNSAIGPRTGTGTSTSSTTSTTSTTTDARPLRDLTLPDSGSAVTTGGIDTHTTTLSATNTVSLGEAGPSGSMRAYTVKQGDSMWVIAQKELGNGAKWQIIAKANPRIDPNNLRVGQTLAIPVPEPTTSTSASANTLSHSATTSAANTATTTSPDGKTYTVKEGDSMWTIAEDQLGSGIKWQRIAKANPRIDPNHLRIGQKLVIPDAR